MSGTRTNVQSDLGFTLIEVLAAILIVSLVFGLLLESVTRNLADIGRARAEARAAQLAENRLRDLRADLETGAAKLEDGTKDGVFEEPDTDLHWRITVVPQRLALPADYKGELPPSPIFDAKNEASPTPTGPGAEPPLRMIEVRVFTADQDPEMVDPYVVLVTAQPDSARLQQLQQQQGQAQGQQPQQNTPGDPNTTVLPGTNPWQNPGMRR